MPLPFLTIMEYMTRKCGSCSTPAPNDKAKFCNECGSAIVDVPDTHFPVCDSCGDVVSDTLAQFCTRCGTIFATAATRPAQQPIGQVSPSVVLTKKRTTLPVQEEPGPAAPVA